MPELPEVETVVRGLKPKVAGRTIDRVDLRRADIVSPPGVDLTPLLVGRKVADVERRAKRIVFTLSGGARFYIHLGMTGQLTVDAPGAPDKPHTHLVIDLTGRPAAQIRFRDPRRFGGVFWLGDNDWETGLGPEPLTLTPRRLAVRLVNTKRAVKIALLDQRLIAGIGNIYADEALFDAGIHPLAMTNDLTATQTRALLTSIKKVLRRAIKHRGSTLRDFVDADGESGRYRSRHRVYDRAGEPCPRCKGCVIVRIVLGGRSTCFCPTCQPR
ncbi:MAG TPA: bifunctional DNA-formamidopyrimidine glycosylase/DNA-(apurinic or apyrimidinic site) lyase [Tepidisphaeraceae bacterium]|nr:bifunctional DNA-formamidopyrimidine glycosylase/DNA-(apurinic or apyrimidinic site) lyase [Tepidisphaeraceae bacterium]